MKKLKLDHKQARLVLSGSKSSTWRLFDDKDLSVDDSVELIDKVEPSKPETWRPIGVAHINRVIEKRLSELDEEEVKVHDSSSSPVSMLRTAQEYYGSNVTPSTVVKIIYFDFTPLNAGSRTSEGNERQNLGAVKIYADGGSRGNPGPSASGYVIMGADGVVLVDKGVYLGITTNNQAEYLALKFALEEAQRMRVRTADVYMDSLLVTNQMNGVFKVKNRDLWPIHDAVKQLITTFRRVSFTYVPRELNKLADAAVNRALDEAHKRAPEKLS